MPITLGTAHQTLLLTNFSEMFFFPLNSVFKIKLCTRIYDDLWLMTETAELNDSTVTLDSVQGETVPISYRSRKE